MLLDGEWANNEFTLRGTRAHENADLPAGLLRERVRVERALPIWSERLGLVGRADVVQFVDGVPYPVEYKISRLWPQKLARQAAEVQLCAQGLCLEEMFGQPVPEGAIFSKTSQRRRVVPLSPELRAQTLATLEALRRLLAQEALPRPAADERCRYCSLQGICMPHLPQALAQWRPVQP